MKSPQKKPRRTPPDKRVKVAPEAANENTPEAPKLTDWRQHVETAKPWAIKGAAYAIVRWLIDLFW